MRINSRKPGRPKQYEGKRIPVQVYLDADLLKAWDAVRGDTTRRDDVVTWLSSRADIQAQLKVQQRE